MMDVGAEFVLLSAGATHAFGTQLNAREIVSEAVQRCFVAMDGEGHRHFLIATNEQKVSADDASQGVAVSSRVLVVPPVGEQLFVDLQCRISSLDLVFERLVEDVLARLAAHPDRPPSGVCKATLADWRTLLKSAGSPLSREQVVGIAGELEVLSRFDGDPATVLASWTGPRAAIHDFSNAGAEIEVKSTVSVDGNFIRISNIDQLDPSGLEALFLAVVHFRENGAGFSLDDRIRALLDHGFPRDVLVGLVAEAGYVFESGSDGDVRLSVRGVRVWDVGDRFPGLRRSEIRHRLTGVSDISYDLALDSAPPMVKQEVAEELFRSWVVSA